MRISLIVMMVVALQGAVLGAYAQETKQPGDTYAVPGEHKDFVDQFKTLLKKFPKAEKRFKLADMGDPPMAGAIIWKCKEWPDGFVDCKPEPPR